MRLVNPKMRQVFDFRLSLDPGRVKYDGEYRGRGAVYHGLNAYPRNVGAVKEKDTVGMVVYLFATKRNRRLWWTNAATKRGVQKMKDAGYRFQWTRARSGDWFAYRVKQILPAKWIEQMRNFPNGHEPRLVVGDAVRGGYTEVLVS